MANSSDSDLLRQYVEGGAGAQAAFGALVARHVDLVYTSAARQLRDRHAAEDVTQTVFIVLARKAPSLSARPQAPLSPWLLSVTRYAARDWRKTEGRRRRHERAAVQDRADEMARTTPTESMAARDAAGHEPPGAGADRASAGPTAAALAVDGLDEVLDDALARLSEPARAALVLRFFEDKTFREVGERLGIAEAAAKQRVFRALERLRGVLTRRGVTAASSEALGVTLAATAVQPAPPGVAGAVSAGVSGAASSAAAVSSAAGGGGGAAQGVILAMASAKLKAGLIAAAALLLLAAGLGAGAWYLHGRQTSVTASAAVDLSVPTLGLVPGPGKFDWPDWVVPPEQVVTPARQVNGGAAQPPPPYDGPPVSGVARTPDGRPVSGADVLLSTSEMASITIGGAGRPQTFGAMRGKTGADGSFALRPNAEPRGLVVVSDEGVGSVPLSRDAPAATVVMRPWGRVEGRVRVGSRPLAGAEVSVSTSPGGLGEVPVRTPRAVITDDAGRFVIDRVPPGRARVTYHGPGPESPAPRSISVDVQAGTTTTVAIGGTGRAVVGRLAPANDPFAERAVSLMPSLPPPPVPRDRNLPALNATPEGPAQLREVYRSQEYLAWQDRINQNYPGKVEADGTFRIEDVPAGVYRLTATATARDAASGYTERTGLGSKDVTVPPTVPATGPAGPGGTTADYDAGEVKMRQYPRMMIGEVAPPLAGVDRDGKAVKLGDLRGRYVLFAITQGPGDVAWQHMLRARGIWDRFGDDPRLVMVSFYTRAWSDDLKTSIDAARMEWTHLSMGDTAEDALPPQYTGAPDRLFLIDPKGRVVARYLSAPRANYAL